MPLDFPTSPTLGQTYTFNGKTWQWNGTGWVSPTIAASSLTTVASKGDVAAMQVYTANKFGGL